MIRGDRLPGLALCAKRGRSAVGACGWTAIVPWRSREPVVGNALKLASLVGRPWKPEQRRQTRGD
jgi:hypothetical protein